MTTFQDECTKDLEAAEPVIWEAEAALNSLDKASLGELKSFGNPAAEVINVVSACMVLTAPEGKIPKVFKTPHHCSHKLTSIWLCLCMISLLHETNVLKSQSIVYYILPSQYGWPLFSFCANN